MLKEVSIPVQHHSRPPALPLSSTLPMWPLPGMMQWGWMDLSFDPVQPLVHSYRYSTERNPKHFNDNSTRTNPTILILIKLTDTH